MGDRAEYECQRKDTGQYKGGSGGEIDRWHEGR
jgi:hypothetical protein